MAPAKNLNRPTEVDSKNDTSRHGKASEQQRSIGNLPIFTATSDQGIASMTSAQSDPWNSTPLLALSPSRLTANCRLNREFITDCTLGGKGAFHGYIDATPAALQQAVLVDQRHCSYLIHLRKDSKICASNRTRLRQEFTINIVFYFMRPLQYMTWTYSPTIASGLLHEHRAQFTVKVTSLTQFFSLLLSIFLMILRKRQWIIYLTKQNIVRDIQPTKSAIRFSTFHFSIYLKVLNLRANDFCVPFQTIKPSSISLEKGEYYYRHYVTELQRVGVDASVLSYFERFLNDNLLDGQWSSFNLADENELLILLQKDCTSKKGPRPTPLQEEPLTFYDNPRLQIQPAATRVERDAGERSFGLNSVAVRDVSMLESELILAIRKEEEVAIEENGDDKLGQSMQERQMPVPCMQRTDKKRSLKPSKPVRTLDQSTVINRTDDHSTQTTSESSSEFVEDDSVIRLSRQFLFYKKIQSSLKERQPLSYYFVDDSELVVHIENPSQEDQSLKALFTDALQSCNMFEVQVTVKPYSAGAQLCSGPRVGSAVFVTNLVNNKPKTQSLGMYLEYDGCVYWASAAHGLLQILLDEKSAVLKKAIGDSYVTLMHAGEQKLRVGFDQTHSLPTPYLCFSYNKCKYSDCNVTCFHSVDIMVGNVPLTSEDLERSSAQDRDVPLMGDEMRFVGRRRNTNGELYKCYSTGIAFYSEQNLDGSILFNVGEVLKDEIVYTSLDGEEIMFSGKIIYNGFPFNALSLTLWTMNVPDTLHNTSSTDTEKVEANNVIFIEPLFNLQPKLGHSGSVWFIPDGNTVDAANYKAVAVTIGFIESYEMPGKQKKAVYIATPLCAALFALSKKYYTVFPDYKKFQTTSLGYRPTRRTTI